MSKPREKWWGYIKAVIRDYPRLEAKYKELHTPSMAINLTGLPTAHNNSSTVENVALRELNPTEQREYDAVHDAIEATRRMYGAKERLMIIDLVFWKRSHTLQGAALKAHVSEKTATRFHTSFIYLVACKYGLDENGLKKPNKRDKMVSSK